MPLPAFDRTGLIPAFIGTDARTADRSPYRVTMVELVDRLGTSSWRRTLLRNLLTYRDMMAGDGYANGIQFIDGSFVENVEVTRGRDPGDIDVFSIVTIPAKYLANPAEWPVTGFPFWDDELTNWQKNKDRFHLDTYGIVINTSTVDEFIDGITYWYSLFSHRRDTFDWKGFASVTLDQGGDAAALAELDRLDDIEKKRLDALVKQQGGGP